MSKYMKVYEQIYENIWADMKIYEQSMKVYEQIYENIWANIWKYMSKYMKIYEQNIKHMKIFILWIHFFFNFNLNSYCIAYIIVYYFNKKRLKFKWDYLVILN